MKKVLVTGSSGYVANYIMKMFARQYPHVTVVGMSRSAKPRDEEIQRLENVHFMKGDCLKPSTFKEQLQDVDSVIHCVGTLIEKKNNPNLTYDAMNRDSAINMAKELQEYAHQQNQQRNFVLISSEKAPPFLPKYLTSKLEAEQYILNNCPNLKTTILRPGFIVDKHDRWWSIPLKLGVDMMYYAQEYTIKNTPLNPKVDFLFPAKSTRLSTVAYFSIQGALGLVEEPIQSNDKLINYENQIW